MLVWHVRHPSQTKPWYRELAADVLRRAFVDGEDWRSALAAVSGRPGGYDHERERWRQVGPQKAWEHALNELKVAAGTAMPDWVTSAPLAGEATVADIDSDAPAGQEARVLARARSVAVRRVPGVALARRDR